MEKECEVPGCRSTDIVHSGVDACITGIPTGTFCYRCNTVYAHINAEIKSRAKV